MHRAPTLRCNETAVARVPEWQTVAVVDQIHELGRNLDPYLMHADRLSLTPYGISNLSPRTRVHGHSECG